MHRRRFLIGAGSLLSAPFVSRAWAAEPLEVYYNSQNSLDSNLVKVNALKLALEKCEKPYKLLPSPTKYVNAASTFNAMESGEQVDLYWTTAAKTFSDSALLVPFPLDAGLLGYRGFLIDGGRQAEFSSVETLSDMKRFIALQGTGWSDVVILREAGLTVRTALGRNLLSMVIGRRGDYFPVQLSGTFNIRANRVEEFPDLAVEQTQVLKYPLTSALYTSHSRPVLRDDLLRGLRLAHEDGSYREMMQNDPDVKRFLKDGNLAARNIIEIDNPLLPNELKNIDPAYWWRG